MLDPTDFKETTLNSSEKRILGLLFKNGAQTQSQLCEVNGLTQQSTSRLISSLQEKSMVIEGERVSTGKRGYPSMSFILRPGYAYSLGVSLMADAASISLVDFTGNVIASEISGLPSMSQTTVKSWIQNAIPALLKKTGLNNAPIVGVGVGVSGSHISVGEGFNTPFALEEWAGQDVNKIFSKFIGLSAWSDNDGNVAAIGESISGVGKWAESFAYIYISSGIGGGIILNRELWRGRFGNAGEFAGGLPPNIYPFPNLELLRQLVARHGIPFDTVHDLVDSYDPDWPAIDEWISRVRDSLSIVVSNATAILDLDAVVLGGRIPKPLCERVIPHLDLFDQKRRGQERPMAKIVPAEAEGDSVALGAAVLPLQNTFFK